MKLGNFLRRKVICDTSALKEVITQWLETEGWKFENFVDFAELIGLKTPIRLSCLKEESFRENGGKVYSFKGVTVRNVKVQIKIYFPNFRINYPQILIKKGEKIRKFAICPNQGNDLPKVIFEESIIKRFGKELTLTYFHWGWHYFNSILTFNGTNQYLEIKIYEPKKQEEKFQKLIQEKWKDLEEYMIGLEQWNLIVSEVYRKVCGFFSKDMDIREEVTVIYTDKEMNDEEIKYYCVKNF